MDLITDTSRRSLRHDQCFGYDHSIPEAEWGIAVFMRHVHPDDRSVSQGIIESARSKWRPFDFEERIVRPDGAVRILETHGRWITNEGGTPFRLIATSQDITERKQAEEQRDAANRALVEENRKLRSRTEGAA